MRVLITGVAGFVGSNLADRLLAERHDVLGIDALTDYYSSQTKRSNLAKALDDGRFEFIEGDLLTHDLRELLAGIDVVFHQAGQPGVRRSWADGFHSYVEANILATQRLLEAAKHAPLRRFVYASSSSVYGAAETYPTPEHAVPAPVSPYGVTKLAGEHLCSLYHRNFDVPSVSLRYFTVYGPRQRPDMATSRLIDSAVTGSLFTMYGDGSQIRDFTYIDDIVEANLAAAQAVEAVGRVFNIGGGSAASIRDVVEAVTTHAGSPPNITYSSTVPGDVFRTGADITQAAKYIGWQPSVELSTGIRQQVEHVNG